MSRSYNVPKTTTLREALSTLLAIIGLLPWVGSVLDHKVTILTEALSILLSPLCGFSGEA